MQKDYNRMVKEMKKMEYRGRKDPNPIESAHKYSPLLNKIRNRPYLLFDGLESILRLGVRIVLEVIPSGR